MATPTATATALSLSVATSAATAALPQLSRSLLLLRGGGAAVSAAAAAALSASASGVSSSGALDATDMDTGIAAGSTGTEATADIDTALSLSGGGDGNGADGNGDGNVSLLGLTITPEARATLAMALAMATHYGAYSFARPTTLSLFTSSSTGFGGDGTGRTTAKAYPLAMGLVSPTSLLLLLGYGGLLERLGPRAALRRSTLYCSAVLGLASIVVHYLQNDDAAATTAVVEFNGVSILPYIVGALFVFRESYVQLITSQHWSFMSSVLTPAQSSTWFAPISGLTSLASAGAGMAVGSLVDSKLGLTGTLGTAAAMLALSTVMTESAYGISEKYGFNPAEEHDEKIAAKKVAALESSEGRKIESSLFRKAADLFARVPVLKALFVEILASQGVSTILNVCYVTKLSSVIPDDKERAGWSGKFFAVINVVSGFLQFGVLPNLMKYIEPSTLWRLVPLIVLCFTANMTLDKDPSLYLVAGTFLTMKAMEFSARRMLDEMVYVPLDFDSRYVGKEVIGVLGYRFGKSGTSLAVSALTSQLNFGLSELSRLTCVASLVWAKCTWSLSNLVPTKAEAEEAFAKIHSKSGKKRR